MLLSVLELAGCRAFVLTGQASYPADLWAPPGSSGYQQKGEAQGTVAGV